MILSRFCILENSDPFWGFSWILKHLLDSKNQAAKDKLKILYFFQELFAFGHEAKWPSWWTPLHFEEQWKATKNYRCILDGHCSLYVCCNGSVWNFWVPYLFAGANSTISIWVSRYNFPFSPGKWKCRTALSSWRISYPTGKFFLHFARGVLKVRFPSPVLGLWCMDWNEIEA